MPPPSLSRVSIGGGHLRLPEYSMGRMRLQVQGLVPLWLVVIYSLRPGLTNGQLTFP
jgi:hypothetical protein